MKVGNLSLIKSIGKGTMGEVFLSSKKDSKEYYATKKIKKEYADRPQVKKYFINEITILKKLKHNKIVRLIELKQTPSHYYIVMEYCNGGSLLSCLKKYMTLYKKPFSEEIAQYLMRQIVSGVKYIHEKGIIHRDLKLDNILVKFYSEDDFNKYNMMKTHVKISDFGISARLGEGELAHTTLGSPAYMDPFILKKLNERNDLADSDGYDQKADIWSLGAMCYEMIMGKRLFTGRNIKDLYQKVEIGNYSLPTHLSKEVVSFLNGMLQYDSKKRLNIEEISRHQFLTRDTKDFNSIDFALVCNKLGDKGINFNIKNNDTLWKIFNEETEVKLNSIPTRILDNVSYPDPDSQSGETENESRKEIQPETQKIEEFQMNQQYPVYKDNFNKINIYYNDNQNVSKNQINNNGNTTKFKEDKQFKKADNKITNNTNFDNAFGNTVTQYPQQGMTNFNNFHTLTTNFNYNNNLGNIGTNATYHPYIGGPVSTTQNYDPQFFGGNTIGPQTNNFNINTNEQYNPNYPGDIKITKEKATTDESCMHQ